VRALILAAGLGTRLRPLTDNLPKPLIPLANIPLLDYHLDYLQANGISEVAINLHYLPHMIRRHLGDKSQWGLKLAYSHEPELLGTGGGIKQMAGLLPRDTLLVLNSDMLTDISLEELFNFHKQKRALATMMLDPFQTQVDQRGVGIDAQHRIHQIAGRPQAAPPGLRQLMFAGIHIIEPELLNYIPDGKACCINADIYPQLIRQGEPVYGYLMPKGRWWHVGTAESYLMAHQAILSGKLPFKSRQPLARPGVWQGSNVSISARATLIPPVMIGDNCLIEVNAVVGPYVSLGEDCRIEEDVILKYSSLWDWVKVKPGARLNKCVLGHGVTVEAGASLTDRLIDE
jgi:NDP-sugar pyrophosphorylase family protein